jgi:hypothetical protein
MNKPRKTLVERVENLEYHMVKVEARLDNIEANMVTKDYFHEHMTTLDNKLDFIINMLDKDETERLVMGAQVGRHEDWIIRASRQNGIRYNPGTR